MPKMGGPWKATACLLGLVVVSGEEISEIIGKGVSM